MRKKSPVTIQKWVDSIAEDSETSQRGTEEKTPCDSVKLETDDSVIEGSNENLKEKLNVICNKLSLKSKDLIAKTSQRLRGEDIFMEQASKEVVNDSKKEEFVHENKNEDIQRSQIGLLVQSSSESQNCQNRRLNDIGKSFSVSHETDLIADEKSTETLIYGADEDISTKLSTLNPNFISDSTFIGLSHSQRSSRRKSLSQARMLKEYSASESQPQEHTKNPLLRDASFQSDSSHCSSVESLLEARKPDAETILINLGFGPAHGVDDVVSKIPRR